ncbi:MAG: uncharacterized protein JWR69_4267 [Pedosphaera sp.]|nr:uncharacterized protein [Pedosphaera sp.]
MSVVSKLVEFMKSVDRKVWPAHRLVFSPDIADLLRQHRLVVADVGSTGGPEETWLCLKEFIHFLTFEPNPRPGDEVSDDQTTNFPIGLWSTRGKRDLYVTAHPDSSSLLPINGPLFADFLSKDGLEVVGSATIELETLDHLLVGKPKLLPDFLKIDVEGGELEVLKGARQTLAQSILGLRVETSFLELQLGRPLLWEVDAFLRQQGFVLFHLGRNHWIRNNALHGYSSAPQLIWGDAVYFLTREEFLKRLAACPAGERPVLLAKFVVILVRHGVHDYSCDIVEAAQQGGLVPGAFAESLKALVKNSMDTSAWYLIKGCFGVAFALLILLLSLPFAEPRKRGVFYLKQKAGRLSYDLWRLAALEGRAHNACVGDPFV